MPVNHSKTWPVSAMAQVELTIDQQGRTFASLTETPEMVAKTSAYVQTIPVHCQCKSSPQNTQLKDEEGKTRESQVGYFITRPNVDSDPERGVPNKEIKKTPNKEVKFDDICIDAKIEDLYINENRRLNTIDLLVPDLITLQDDKLKNLSIHRVETHKFSDQIDKISETNNKYKMNGVSGASSEQSKRIIKNKKKANCDCKKSDKGKKQPCPASPYECILAETDCDFGRCSCQLTKSNGCVYGYQDSDFDPPVRKKKIIEELKQPSMSDTEMTVSTVLRSNSCDSNYLYHFNQLKKLRKSLESNPKDSPARTSGLFKYNSKISYCIQLLALSPNTLLKSVHFPTVLERRYSNNSVGSLCRWIPAEGRAFNNDKLNAFRKGRSKSVSHMTTEKVSAQTPAAFRRCNSTIEVPKRRQSELVANELANGEGLLSKTPLSARKTQTLYRHYYPEGGWGWTIVVVCVIVSILDHGMQLAAAVLVKPAAKKFGVASVHAAGEFFVHHQLFIICTCSVNMFFGL